MIKFKYINWALVLMFFSTYSFANSIVGIWQTNDKVTKQPTSLVQIWEKNNKYFAKVVKIFPVNGAKDSDVCKKCTGDMHNKPVLGLVVIRDMVLNGDKFSGGKALDPRSGKEYNCVLDPTKSPNTLYVRGYIGFSLFGKTEVWVKPSGDLV